MNVDDTLHNSRNGGYPSTAHRAAQAASIVLGLLLLFSAAAKIAAPRSFLDIIAQFQLLPSSFLLPAAAIVVGLESLLGVLFLTGVYRRKAAWVNLMLMLVFTLMMVEAIRRGFSHCGCFGEVLQLGPSVEIWIDLVLLGLTLLVLWRGTARAVGGWWTGLAGGIFSAGMVLFLLGAPVSPAADSTRLDVDAESLSWLEGAVPPLHLPKDGLIFLFSADCEHCWAFAGGVQMTADRLEDFEVHGVTFSGEPALSEFREAFRPSYPIHRISAEAFKQLMPVWPGAIWIQNGEVAQGWSNFVPSHRELMELGGYSQRPEGASRSREGASPGDSLGRPSPADLFGGTVSGRN